MRRKALFSLMLSAVLFFVLIPGAFSHVTVQPGESTTGAYEKYTVRVPVEKDIPTTEVELKVPKNVEVISIMPVPSWDYKLKKDDDDRITSLTWKAKGGGIRAGEFTEFSFVGVNPEEEGEVAWKAHQTYEDGSVVKWVGEPDSKEPASITQIKPGDGSYSHSHDTATQAVNKPDSKEEDNSNPLSLLPAVLAGIAVVLSLIALLRKKA